MMQVVILAGGFGTRISDVSEDIPKALIPIGNRPIIWHIMKYYASYGYKDFILCLGYKSQKIKEFFLNYESMTRDFTMRSSGSTKKEICYHNNVDDWNWNITFAETRSEEHTSELQ